MKFRKFGGEPIPDAAQYVKDYIAEHPETELMVGTDSQNYNEHTCYSTVIVMYIRGRGGHVIVWQQRLPRIRDLFSKIWKEVEFTDLAVRELTESGIRQEDIQVHLDVNPLPEFKSNICYSSAVGFFKGTGFSSEQILVKPLGYVASHVADDFVRQGG